MLIDYHMHFEYGSYDEKWVSLFFEQANKMNLSEIGITEHSHAFIEFKDLYYDELILDNSEIGKFQRKWLDNNKSKFVHTLDEYYHFINKLKEKGYPVKFGIEICNFKNQEKVKEIISKYNFDYIILSIHFIKGWGFDFNSLKEEFNNRKLEDIWNDYVLEIENCANSGLYDVLGHPFNLRLFKNIPNKDNVEYLLYKAANILKNNNMIVDVNTGTFYRYPINEISPYSDFMKYVSKYKLPIIFSSDAHQPEHVGMKIIDAAKYVKSFGITEFITFENRNRIIKKIPNNL